MKNKNINIIKDYYEKNLIKHKKGPKAVNWRNKKTQNLRFKKICEIGNLNNKKILDVGCGLSHLHDYLLKKKIKCKYIGIDISSEMISLAKKKSKINDSKLYCEDILKLKNDLKKKLQSDYVVNSGLFTVKHTISSKDWWVFIQKMILNMFRLSKKGISFNLMRPNVDYKENHLHYQSIDILLNFLHKKVSKNVIIKFDYPLWEYTCFVYKK